jgi:hypothetical protein
LKSTPLCFIPVSMSSISPSCLCEYFYWPIIRGRHQKRYSVVAITLPYVFAFSHNASTLRIKVIAFYSYRSVLMDIVIASYSYCSGLMRIAITSNSYCSKIIQSLSLLKVMLLTAFSYADCVWGHVWSYSGIEKDKVASSDV